MRALPDKLLGTIFLALSIVVLLVLPFFSTLAVRSSYFKPLFQIFFWLFLVIALTLGWVGGKPIEPTYYFIGQFSTFSYFFYFLVLIPFSAKIDLFFLENSMYRVAFFFRTRFDDLYNDSFF